MDLGYLLARYSKLIGGLIGVFVGKAFTSLALDDLLGADLSDQLELAIIATATAAVVGLFPKNAEKSYSR